MTKSMKGGNLRPAVLMDMGSAEYPLVKVVVADKTGVELIIPYTYLRMFKFLKPSERCFYTCWGQA